MSWNTWRIRCCGSAQSWTPIANSPEFIPPSPIRLQPILGKWLPHGRVLMGDFAPILRSTLPISLVSGTAATPSHQKFPKNPPAPSGWHQGVIALLCHFTGCTWYAIGLGTMFWPCRPKTSIWSTLTELWKIITITVSIFQQVNQLDILVGGDWNIFYFG